MTYIDRTFREYGVKRFGKEKMNRLTDEQIEAARVRTFQDLTRLTAKFGRLNNGRAENIFCYYIKWWYFDGEE